MSFVVDKEGVYLTKGGDTVEITSVTERIDEWKWKKRGCCDFGVNYGKTMEKIVLFHTLENKTLFNTFVH